MLNWCTRCSGMCLCEVYFHELKFLTWAWASFAPKPEQYACIQQTMWCFQCWIIFNSADFMAFSVCRSSLLDWKKKKTKIKLNPTAKDCTTSCSCTNSENFWLPVARFVEKLKNRKIWSRLVATGLSSHHVLDLTHATKSNGAPRFRTTGWIDFNYSWWMSR